MFDEGTMTGGRIAVKGIIWPILINFP